MKNKYLIAIIILILLLVGIALYYFLQRQSFDYRVYSTEAECELETGKVCRFSTCDYKCTGPYGYFKGWIPE